MNNNHACIVCLGSNVDGEIHLQKAYKALERLFFGVKMGKILRTKAVGDIPQPNYLNQAARFTTNLTSEEVETLLKGIEKENGRKSGDKLKGLVSLDIDLLQYDDKILRPDDLLKDYVQLVLQGLD